MNMGREYGWIKIEYYTKEGVLLRKDVISTAVIQVTFKFLQGMIEL